jgi:hypothetical protein
MRERLQNRTTQVDPLVRDSDGVLWILQHRIHADAQTSGLALEQTNRLVASNFMGVNESLGNAPHEATGQSTIGWPLRIPSADAHERTG